MIAKALEKVTSKAVGVAAQVAGAGGTAIAVGGLAGVLWGVLAASLALVVGGTLAEMS